jgi:hypothetical protein
MKTSVTCPKYTICIAPIADALHSNLALLVGPDEVCRSDCFTLVKDLLQTYCYSLDEWAVDPLKEEYGHYNLTDQQLAWLRQNTYNYFGEIIRRTIGRIVEAEYVITEWVAPDTVVIEQSYASSWDNQISPEPQVEMAGLELDKRYY